MSASTPRRTRSAAARARMRAQRGFTLIELTVALMAGLIVGMAVVGLSRDSTSTFHEEMRASAAEANLRSAVDRLRADLARAAYMSTGDIATDPMVVRVPGVVNPAPPGFLGLADLASIQFIPGTAVANGLTLSAQNGINPAALQIGGNMTTTDQFAASLQPASAGGCQQIFLDPQTPAMFRVLSSPTPAKELNNLFQPSPTGVLGRFIVRVFDKTGHSQFLVTCAGVPTGILGGAPNWQPFVLVDPATPVLTAQQTQGVGSTTGFAAGNIWVNPVQIVRWEIVPATTEPVQYTASPMGKQPLTPALADPIKYDLVRSYVDAKTGTPIPETKEVVAEYAVDLDFAFSVETGLNDLTPTTVTLPFGDARNLQWAQALSKRATPAVNGPARIRSVRARLVTRTAQPDRAFNVPVPGPAGPYVYRYCVLPGGCNLANAAGILQFARARTLTIEVSLPNQSRSFNP